jgi:hypothetical protein
MVDPTGALCAKFGSMVIQVNTSHVSVETPRLPYRIPGLYEATPSVLFFSRCEPRFEDGIFRISICALCSSPCLGLPVSEPPFQPLLFFIGQ